MLDTRKQQQDVELEDIRSGRTIWSFWDGNPPDLVLRCFESIKMNNPTRPVVVVSRSTLDKFLDPSDYPLFHGIRGGPDDFSCVQYLSAWVRLTLLHKYGGVWFDASTICTNSVDSWATTINHDPSKIVMFPMHSNPLVHGNWAMAAMKPRHPVIEAWREELSEVYNDIGPGKVPTEYIQRSFEEYPELDRVWNNDHPPPLPYLWVYLALQVVLAKKPHLNSTIRLLSSTDGPMYRRYLYNIEAGVTDKVTLSEFTANDLAAMPLSLNGHDRWFIKLVGNDRKPVQDRLDMKTFAPGSVLDMLSRISPRPIAYGRNLWAINNSTDEIGKATNNLDLPSKDATGILSKNTNIPRPKAFSMMSRSSSSRRSIAATTA